MHSARLKVVGNDYIESEWDAHQNGKLADTKKFFLMRKKS